MPRLKIAAENMLISDKSVTLDVRQADELRRYLEKAHEFFDKQNQPAMFNIVIDYFVPKASQKAIGLYWRFCSALALDNQITTDQMHEALKDLYVEKIEQTEYHAVRKEKGWKLVPRKVLAPKHMRDMDRREFSWFLEQVVAEVLQSENAYKVYYEWQQYRFWLGMQEEPLHYDSHDDYKNRTLVCEACGKWLGPANESIGSLAHIKSRGAGGADVPVNWAYLCDSDHALWDNGKGRDAFLVGYPHLKPKFDKAVA